MSPHPIPVMLALALGTMEASVLPRWGEDAVVLDVGSMQAKPHLGYGWSVSEAQAGRTYRWMKSLEAQAWIELAEPADRIVWVEAASQFLPYTTQVLAVYVNRRFAGEWAMDHRPGFDVYRLAIPAHFWRGGRNEILLRAAFRVTVGRDPRPLSVCVDRLVVEAE